MKTPFKFVWWRFIWVLLGVILGGLAITFYPFKLSKQNVTIEVVDMRYACGDCYIRFQISKVTTEAHNLFETGTRNNHQNSPFRFEGWDILVRYKGSDTYLDNYQNELFSKYPDCAWPTFRLKGQFKRRLIYSLLYDGDHYDGLYFDADSGTALNKVEPSCKGLAQEMPLK